jgi:hypothetical protein
MSVRVRHRAAVQTGSTSADTPDDDYLVVITTRDRVAARFGWRTLLAATGYAHLLVLAIVSLAVSRGLGPVRVLLLGLVVVALALLRKPGWTGVALMVVAAFAVTADALYLGSMTGAFHPTSAAQFISSAGGLTAFVVTLVAATACLRIPDGGAGPDRSALAAAGTGVAVGVTVLALALGSSIAYDEPAPRPRDVRLRAFWYDCTPRTLRAAPGQVSIYVRNEDGSRRAFEIAELGVVLNVPAHRAARTEFTAGPGRYVYVCHVPGRGKRIRGELVVG